MAGGRNVTISLHSAIIPTKIVLQHIIAAATDEYVKLFTLRMNIYPNNSQISNFLGRGNPVLHGRLGREGGQRIPVAVFLATRSNPRKL